MMAPETASDTDGLRRIAILPLDGYLAISKVKKRRSFPKSSNCNPPPRCPGTFGPTFPPQPSPISSATNKTPEAGGKIFRCTPVADCGKIANDWSI